MLIAGFPERIQQQFFFVLAHVSPFDGFAFVVPAQSPRGTKALYANTA
jgi:hypothetical protein